MTADAWRSYFDSVIVNARHLKVYSRFAGQLALTALLCALCHEVSAVELEAVASRTKLAVGQEVTLTVTGTRDTVSGTPQFAGARLSVGEHWQHLGQTIGSERFEAGALVKTWEFELKALLPGTTLVVPIIYLETRLGLPGWARRDSVIGAPVSLIIVPAPGPARWPWYAAAIIAAGTLGWIIRFWIGWARRRRPPEPLPSPLAEALQMLEGIREHRRIDRVERYFADVEGIIYGYLARRLGRTRAATTASEAVVLVHDQADDPEVLRDLEGLLTRCAHSRFGGERAGFEELAGIEEKVRDLLERLDALWVSDNLSGRPTDTKGETRDRKPRC